MKKGISLLLAMILVMSLFVVSAYAAECKIQGCNKPLADWVFQGLTKEETKYHIHMDPDGNPMDCAIITVYASFVLKCTKSTNPHVNELKEMVFTQEHVMKPQE